MKQNTLNAIESHSQDQVSRLREVQNFPIEVVVVVVVVVVVLFPLFGKWAGHSEHVDIYRKYLSMSMSTDK